MSSPDQDIDLSEASLCAEARERTGLSDFGEDGFRERLRALLGMYDGPAGLSARGRKATRRRLVELLANRLAVHDAFRRHGDAIRARRIVRPMYLTGLPRTGTSMLFNLLAADPEARPLYYWEGCHPAPPATPLAPGEPDPRLVALRASLERARLRNPEMAKIHAVEAEGPEECVQLLAHTLGGVQNGIEPLISPYREHFLAQDLRPIYAYYVDLLKLVDWQRPGRRWLLKSPAHLWALDLLVDSFPDACIIQTHRNPLAIIGSYCSMMAALMSIRERVDPLELGPVVLEYLARSVERGMAARAASDPARFVDVGYDELLADPLATVERIYEGFALELPAATRAALADHVASHPQNRHGSHDYSLAQYGLSPEAVTRRLAAYIDRFHLPVG
jgi:hypothetical protein